MLSNRTLHTHSKTYNIIPYTTYRLSDEWLGLCLGVIALSALNITITCSPTVAEHSGPTPSARDASSRGGSSTLA